MADRLLETGERCHPDGDRTGSTIYEHAHRYRWASAVVSHQRVLDAACGEGYGSDLLAESAAEVCGVDLDPEVIAHARRKYQRPHLVFEEADLRRLEALGRSDFDVVTCFESIEHVEDHDRVLRGIKSVLRPDGILLISTPDRDSPDGKAYTNNPFHVGELNREEFEALLSRYFRNYEIWLQTPLAGSSIAREGDSLDAAALVPFGYTPDGFHFRTAASAGYLLAGASDAPLPRLSASLLCDVTGTGSRMLAAHLQEAFVVRAEAERARDVLDAELARVKRELQEAISLRAQTEREYDSLHTELTHFKSELLAMDVGSNGLDAAAISVESEHGTHRRGLEQRCQVLSTQVEILRAEVESVSHRLAKAGWEAQTLRESLAQRRADRGSLSIFRHALTGSVRRLQQWQQSRGSARGG